MFEEEGSNNTICCRQVITSQIGQKYLNFNKIKLLINCLEVSLYYQPFEEPRSYLFHPSRHLPPWRQGLS